MCCERLLKIQFSLIFGKYTQLYEFGKGERAKWKYFVMNSSAAVMMMAPHDTAGM